MAETKTPGMTPRARFALVSTIVLILSSFPLFLVVPKDWVGMTIVVWFFLLVSVPVMPFALHAGIRNPVLRYLFGLTAGPLYIVLFVVMLHLISSDVPLFAETLSQSLAAGGRRAGMLHAVIALLPTTIVFAAWYAVLRLADRGLARRLE